MKINFDATLNDFDGNPLTEGDNQLTLRIIAVNALMAPHPGEQNLTGEEKLFRYKLASRIYVGGEIEITIEDAAKLKTLIGKAYNPVVVGPAYELLEG